ncbi:hypothetical protein CCHR01_19934 [Colletotrichum chrysophilum]|uniref:Uncharacterized protein n=1 Tax=Colletotrichum chrysophilum TaxID=1836956 RepID=A0AAD8ZY46_9PEZI|nr:hypothetical protein CCHR01_19934 [Colletotrichum chrysophilum]
MHEAQNRKPPSQVQPAGCWIIARSAPCVGGYGIPTTSGPSPLTMMQISRRAQKTPAGEGCGPRPVNAMQRRRLPTDSEEEGREMAAQQRRSKAWRKSSVPAGLRHEQ